MKNQIKVAIIEPVGGHCGMDYYDFGLARGLAVAGADVVLHTCDETQAPPDSTFEVRRTYRHIYGTDPVWIRGLRFLFGSLRALISSVFEGRRIVHFHFFHIGYPELLNISIARLLGRKIVITAHDVESFVESLENPRLRRYVYRSASGVIAHNNVSKKELVEQVGVKPERIHIIRHGNYLGLVPALIGTEEARSHFGIQKNAHVILYFGQIKDVKGLDILLNAMPEVIARYPDAMLLIGGKPWKTDFTGYEALIENLGIGAACVKRIRYILPEEVSLFFSAADVVVLPYRRIYQSGVVLKAMSYGKAVVVPDLPGMTELVNDDITGYIFKTGDPGSLAERLCSAFDSEERRKAIATAGHDLVSRQYNWERTGMETIELYREIA